jgi:hypothetical protein
VFHNGRKFREGARSGALCLLGVPAGDIHGDLVHVFLSEETATQSRATLDEKR